MKSLEGHHDGWAKAQKAELGYKAGMQPHGATGVWVSGYCPQHP